VAIVGSPNVGKSLLFNRLTGAYATVSNYPGTTVEVSRGRARLPGCAGEIEVVDTPGMYDLTPLSEEERVARRVLLQERPSLVVHVADAKNMPRMLPLTLELIEAGLPVALAVNLMDEAVDRGVSLDLPALERRLGIPVVGTICTSGAGLERLREVLAQHASPAPAVRRCH
jgi:ferrous iron transport protein B